MNDKNNDLLKNDKLIGIEYKKRSGSSSMNTPHYHGHYELFYLLSGERFYFINDEVYQIKTGDIVLIKPNELHRTIDAEKPDYERILIDFKREAVNGLNSNDIDLLSCFNSNIHVISLNLDEQNSMETLLFKMIDESKGNRIGKDIYLKLILTEILILINRLIVEREDSLNFKSSILNKKVTNIINYINANYDKELSVESISKEFFMNPYYFCHIFKKSTGFTFIQYLNSIRIKEAQILLKNSKMNVTEVAEKVGYSSSTHFGRVFKTMTGISPLKYKNN